MMLHEVGMDCQTVHSLVVLSASVYPDAAAIVVLKEDDAGGEGASECTPTNGWQEEVISYQEVSHHIPSLNSSWTLLQACLRD